MSLIPDEQSTETTTEAQTETTTTESTDTTQQTTTTDGTTKGYLLADGVDAEGDAPEWFKGSKYKTVSAQAEAYNELESKFGSFTGAPKEGKYEIEGADFENSPLLKLTAEWGAENQLSNDGLESLIAKVNELAASQIEEDSVNAKTALGDNADKRLGDISQWGKNNLSPDEFTQFQGLAQTAGQIEVIEKLISLTKNSKLVETPSTPPKGNQDAMEELTKMQLATDDKGKRMMDNPAYRAKYNAKKAELSK